MTFIRRQDIPQRQSPGSCIIPTGLYHFSPLKEAEQIKDEQGQGISQMVLNPIWRFSPM